MFNTLIAVVYFVFSVANDYLNVEWHTARESFRRLRAANISLAMGVIMWSPFVLLVVTNNWQIVIADLAGNWFGSYLGVAKYEKVKLAERVDAAETAVEPGDDDSLRQAD